MSNVIDWLKAKAPGFPDLSQAEQAAINDFSMLWSLFEDRVLDASANAAKIFAMVDEWSKKGNLDASEFEKEIKYFENRYYNNGEFTYHFDHLNLRDNDKREAVRAVLDGSDTNPHRRVAAALVIVYRYRNNLFHGLKWRYQLAGQLDNFNTANSVLMKVLDRRGRLGE